MTVFEADPELLEAIDKAHERISELVVEVRTLYNAINAGWAEYTRRMVEAEKPRAKFKSKNG